METGSTGIKPLSGICDIKVTDKLGEIFILSLGEGSFRFFSDIQKVSCDSVGGASGHNANCLDKNPIKLILKEQSFDEAAEIIIDRTETFIHHWSTGFKL
jgi:hypothetical protein